MFRILAKQPYTGPMDAQTKARFEAKARVLKALAHPSRLFIVDVLSRGERCVCDLTELVGADMSTVSKHLSVLKSAGIIAMDKRGLQVFYSLKTPCVLRFFDCVGSVMARSAREQSELASITSPPQPPRRLSTVSRAGSAR